MKEKLLNTVAIGLLAVSAISAAPAHAQQWPAEKALTIVVPYPPGGTMDFTGRLLADRLSKELKQNVIVENRGGASGNIGAAHVARTKADGYTLLVASTSIVIAPSMYNNLNYDVQKDLRAIARVGFFYGALAVNPKVPVKTGQEFIKYIQDPKNVVRYGSGGMGSTAHLSGALLNKLAGGHMTHVPYKGGAPATVDAIGGQIEAIIGTPLVELLSYVEAGQLRLLGLTSPKRSPNLPDVPTVGEFLTGYDSTQWSGVYMAAGTPDDIAQKVSAAINNVLADPEVQNTLRKAGTEPSPIDLKGFEKFSADEQVRWAGIVKSLDLN